MAGACVPPMNNGHPPHFPQITDQGGVILAAPQVVTITFQNYPHRPDVEAFANWIVRSSWLTTVGADYGVGGATSAAEVELASDAPASATQQDIETLLGNEITAGTVPSPSSLGGQGIYMFYFPQGTELSTFFGTSCQTFDGYHDFFNFQGVDVAFAAIADCPPFSLEQIELVGSHELIEAATDPHPLGIGPPTAFAIGDIQSAWLASIGPEVADLCITLNMQDAASGFFTQRIWSNSAAAKGAGSPCIPAPSAPFFTVSASPDATQAVAPGGSVKYTLTGWSDTATVTGWNLSLISGGAFFTNPKLGSFMISNGGTVDLTLTVPSDASPTAIGWTAVQSLDGAGQVVSLWPVAILVQ
jgi:hypothetical protein